MLPLSSLHQVWQGAGAIPGSLSTGNGFGGRTCTSAGCWTLPVDWRVGLRRRDLDGQGELLAGQRGGGSPPSPSTPPLVGEDLDAARRSDQAVGCRPQPTGILGVVSSPRVHVLIYAFVSLDERHDFTRAAAWDGDLGDFSCHLAGGTLEARPKGHYPDVERAREALDPHLRAWALRAELEDGVRIEFRFQSAQDASGLRVMAESAVGIADAMDVTMGHGSYPPPSAKALAASPMVDELLVWVWEVRERRQPMLIPAYLFLTRLTFEYGGQRQAAAALNVTEQVLRKLGELSAKNDPTERRKVMGSVNPLTERERRWLLAALPRLALQVAEIEAGGSPARLTMGDLPSL
jgi:hypothetical protein